MDGGKERLTIKITRSHCLGRGRDVEEGAILRAPGDLTIGEARIKIATGYAVAVPEAAASEIQEVREPETAPGAVATREPTIEKRDPEIMPAEKPATREAPARRKQGSSSKGSSSRRRRKTSSS
jgi:hypothetical protein